MSLQTRIRILHLAFAIDLAILAFALSRLLAVTP